MVMSRARRSWLAIVVAVAATLGAQGLLPSSAAHAAGEYISQEKGFDACVLPSTSAMQTWWNDSPYYNYYLYIGGSEKANCGGATLSSSWISTVVNQGWDLAFIWVGPQMPSSCSSDGWGDTISLNTSTAYSQGENQAIAAYNKLVNLSVNVTNAPVIYDLEAYNGGSSCRAAAKSFMKGWADQMAVAPAQLSGTYGSACASYIDDFASDGNPPDFVDPAAWGSGQSTSSIPCVSSTHWTHNQRHKQYAGGHNETYGGVTINIDNDCANGPVYGNRGNSDGTCV
jgi:hypothetical protein